MKFACPESQNRVFLKCGNVACGSALASLGGLGRSSALGDVEAAVWVEGEASCGCAQAAGAAAPSTKVSARERANGSPVPRLPSAHHFIRKESIMKMNFN